VVEVVVEVVDDVVDEVVVVVGGEVGGEVVGEVMAGFRYRSFAQPPPVPAAQFVAVPNCVASLRLLLHRHSPLSDPPPC